jgi:DNA-binding NarL/FixJ family response regulator
MVGRQVYVLKGGKLGRPERSNETIQEFLQKELSQKIIKGLKKGLTTREIAKVSECSNKTVVKVSKLLKESNLV